MCEAVLAAEVTSVGSPNRVSQLWLAARVSTWLCLLPLRLRRQSLPRLLALIDASHRHNVRASLDHRRTLRIVQRVCRLPIFTLPLFPRTCLREALALYHVFTAMGCAVRFHIGVRKEGQQFVAHSWVTLAEQPILPTTGTSLQAFNLVYSYPQQPHASQLL